MSQRSVREVIERDRLVSITPGASVRAAARAMAENRCGAVLVMEGARLLGIFTERDLLMRVAATDGDLDRIEVEAVMTREPDIIDADAPVADAIRKMDECSYRYLPVVESDGDGGSGRVIGVISARHLPFGEVLAMQGELDQRHALAARIW